MNNSLQVLVAEFNQLHKNQVERHSRVLDLAFEVGEVCKLAFSENLNDLENGRRIPPPSRAANLDCFQPSVKLIALS